MSMEEITVPQAVVQYKTCGKSCGQEARVEKREDHIHVECRSCDWSANYDYDEV